MDINKNANLSMLCDFYELTMGNGYFVQGMQERITYFDIFFRSVPDNGGYAIAAGLEQAIEYIQQLHFDEDDIAYLRSRNMFDEGFLDYLRNFRFTGDIWAVPEGTPIFPREPIMTVRAPAIQAQLVETFLLLTLNHQSLIATKANRVVRAAKGRVVLEFGSRRAQGVDAAVDGARAAYIGGCKGTACTLTDQLYGVPAGGTMAHSWVQMFPSEYEAFKAYCETYPDNPTLLVDTYNTLRSGIPNAIRVFNEVLKPRGLTKCGIRLDSGDMTYLTRKARKMLDEAGWQTCQISCSNSLDEYIIEDILNQGAQIDLFGVGERLITAKSEAVFGGVYKLIAIEDAEGNEYKVLSETSQGSAAQLTLIVGSDGSGLPHPDWMENLRLAVALQNQIAGQEPTLMRPILLRKSRYNQHASTGSLLVEVGAAGNAPEEAALAARLFARNLAELLQGASK